MQLRYPHIIYHFDYGSGTKLTMGQAIKQKRLNIRAYPDLFLAYPTFYPHNVATVGGQFLELKRLGTRLKKRDGSWATPHIAEQATVLEQLREEGYAADFAIGLDEAIEKIESYVRPAKANDVHHGRREADDVPF